MHLEGINLVGANLRQADLSKTSLTVLVGDGTAGVSVGVVMVGPSRSHSISGMRPSEKSTFEEADLREANLRDAELTHCNFSRADLRYADLRGADLRKASLMREQLAEAIGDQDTRLSAPHLRPGAWSLSYEEQLDALIAKHEFS